MATANVWERRGEKSQQSSAHVSQGSYVTRVLIENTPRVLIKFPRRGIRSKAEGGDVGGAIGNGTATEDLNDL